MNALSKIPEINWKALAEGIHADNVTAGWWTNIETGESIISTRNRGEILMLVVTELSEAGDGLFSGCQDDKLPNRPMAHVEIADALIRLLDVATADNIQYASSPGGVPACFICRPVEIKARRFLTCLNSYLSAETRDEKWMFFDAARAQIIDNVSDAMEAHRKGRREDYLESLARAITDIIGMGQILAIPLLEIIEEKRAFNRQREDHKIANRLKDGGKKC